ncbi:MAG: 3-phosphoshikimate 1-carboxyvinyltransferase [Chloroflexi bacterium]|nr:3-phosphoshikimate 1-carboxyvinyltransferase [Chloroflexota bacterium]
MKTAARQSQFWLRSGGSLRGEARVPGDKSISHRAVMLAAVAHGKSQIRGWLAAGDTEATLGAMQDLGARIERIDANTLLIDGGALQEPPRPLDLKNAGTGIRLLAGLLAGQPFPCVLDGSAQLRRRPMKRITAPLQLMGASIESTDGCCPLQITPGRLQGITYDMPIASAQVKSAVLLAGLNADAPTTVLQPGPARDHSERMLRSMGARLDEDGDTVTIHPCAELAPLDIHVPGDVSSAAFLLVAGLLAPGSELTIRGVNLNPTRTGLLDVLDEMGAETSLTNLGEQAGEPVGDILLRHSALQGVEIAGETVVRMIDEFPVLMVAALHAEGETIVRDARELRVKETDRIAVMAQELRKLGAVIEEREDGFRIAGPQSLSGGQVDGHDDHRIAMSLTVAGLSSAEGATITDAACAGDSFPGFAETLQRLGARLVAT